MALQIWKYPIERKDRQVVRIPAPARVLSAAIQNGKLCIWALVDTDCDELNVTVNISGTGHVIAAPTEVVLARYVGTVMDPPFVWHVFAERP